MSSRARPSYRGSYIGTTCGACSVCKCPELSPADCSGVVGFVLYCCTCDVTWSIACYMLGEGVMSCTVRSTRMWSASNLHFYFEVALLVPPVLTCSITLLVRLSYASDGSWSVCSSSSRTASALSPSTATALRCMQHDHAECWSQKKRGEIESVFFGPQNIQVDSSAILDDVGLVYIVSECFFNDFGSVFRLEINHIKSEIPK